MDVSGIVDSPSACIRYLLHVQGMLACVGPGGVTVAQAVGEVVVDVFSVVVIAGLDVVRAGTPTQYA
jgi:hypothetical protein